MTMAVHLPLHKYEPILLQTWACPSKGLSFERCYRVLRQDGTVAAEGLGVWALVDLKTKRLCRVNDVDLHYSTDEPIASLAASCRFRIPSGLSLTPVGTRRIYYSDTDVMRHMNNTNYPDMLCDFLPHPGEGFVRRISISFQREAPLGAEIEVRRGREKTEDPMLSRFYFETKVNGETGVQAMIELVPTPTEGRR